MKIERENKICVRCFVTACCANVCLLLINLLSILTRYTFRLFPNLLWSCFSFICWDIATNLISTFLNICSNYFHILYICIARHQRYTSIDIYSFLNFYKLSYIKLWQGLNAQFFGNLKSTLFFPKPMFVHHAIVNPSINILGVRHLLRYYKKRHHLAATFLNLYLFWFLCAKRQ